MTWWREWRTLYGKINQACIFQTLWVHTPWHVCKSLTESFCYIFKSCAKTAQVGLSTWLMWHTDPNMKTFASFFLLPKFSSSLNILIFFKDEQSVKNVSVGCNYALIHNWWIIYNLSMSHSNCNKFVSLTNTVILPQKNSKNDWFYQYCLSLQQLIWI